MKNQTFGIEIETTGLGCERTARAIAAHFGTTARYVGRHLGDWHVPMTDGRKWVVERDASVTDPCAEVVSPVCRWEDIEISPKDLTVRHKEGMVYRSYTLTREAAETYLRGQSYQTADEEFLALDPVLPDYLN